MKMEKIKLSALKDSLNRCLAACSGGSSWIQELLPDQITAVLEERKLKYRVKDLSFWKDWEYGKIEISDDYFITEVLGDFADSKQEVIVLFDECFKTGEAYKISTKELIYLKEHIAFSDSLFEPFDHLFYFQEDMILIMVHHEGKVITINLAGDQ